MGGDPKAVLDDRVVHHRRDLGGIHRNLEKLLETLVLLAGVARRPRLVSKRLWPIPLALEDVRPHVARAQDRYPDLRSCELELLPQRLADRDDRELARVVRADARAATSPATDAVFTTWPPSGFSTSIGMNECSPCTTPQRFTPSTHCQSASVWSTMNPPPPTPALLQSTCTVPKRSRTASASDCTERRVAHVGEHTDRAELGGRRLERRLLDVGDDDVHPRIDEPRRHRAADATRSAGDDCDVSRELAHCQYRYCSALYGPPGGTPRYSACSSSSLVSLTPSASRCSRATFSSSCFGST